MEFGLNKKLFTLKWTGTIEAGFEQNICYKGYPLWRTSSASIEDYNFFLIDELKETGYIYLMCRDEFEDLYIGKKWETIEEAQDWLETPKI